MIGPPHLNKGDKIGIVAPAGKINIEGISFAINKLKEWELVVGLGKNLFKASNQFSGSDEERTTDLQHMLDDTSIKMILCARGGYGTLRIIDKLNFTIFSKHPKWIVGYSDITILHSHINKIFNIETIHAAMCTSFMKSETAVETLRKVLFNNEQLSYQIETHPLNRTGKAEGDIVGGNLSLLYALNSSASDIDTKGKLLFIEDVNEYLYHIDRMMLNLKRAGKLSQLAGLIVGGMTDMKDNETPFGKTVEEIILDSVSEYNYPVCFNFPAGHINENLALVFGRKARFAVTEAIVTLCY